MTTSARSLYSHSARGTHVAGLTHEHCHRGARGAQRHRGPRLRGDVPRTLADPGTAHPGRACGRLRARDALLLMLADAASNPVLTTVALGRDLPDTGESRRGVVDDPQALAELEAASDTPAPDPQHPHQGRPLTRADALPLRHRPAQEPAELVDIGAAPCMGWDDEGCCANRRVTHLAAFEHEGLTFAPFLEAINPARVRGRNPLFQVIANQDHWADPGRYSACGHSLVPSGRDVRPRLIVVEPDDLSVEMQYATDRALAKRLQSPLNQVVAESHRPFSVIDMLLKKERRLVLGAFAGEAWLVADLTPTATR